MGLMFEADSTPELGPNSSASAPVQMKLAADHNSERKKGLVVKHAQGLGCSPSFSKRCVSVLMGVTARHTTLQHGCYKRRAENRLRDMQQQLAELQEFRRSMQGRAANQ